MNKYQYYINSKPVSKQDLEKKVKTHCYKVINTVYAGEIGIDTEDFDEKKFKKYMRMICGNKFQCVILGSDVFTRKIIQ